MKKVVEMKKHRIAHKYYVNIKRTLTITAGVLGSQTVLI